MTEEQISFDSNIIANSKSLTMSNSRLEESKLEGVLSEHGLINDQSVEEEVLPPPRLPEKITKILT